MMHGIDLTHAISMHPLPLMHLQQQSRDEVRSRSGSLPPTKDRKGASSSYEAAEPSDRDSIAAPPSTANASDIEGQTEPYTQSSDPYMLSSKIKSENEITSLRRSISKRSSIGPLGKNKEGARGKALQTFYQDQNENIERLLKPVSEHRRLAKAEADADHLQYKIAVNASFACNILLAILQIYAAISSGSLSLITTMADAIFDPLSNLMLILSHRAVNKVDSRRFPSGKARIENAGNIFFCFMMTSVSLIIIALSARDLAGGSPRNEDGSPRKTSEFHLPSVIVVGIAFCTKLALFIYCWALRNKYSQVRILWEDHRNDLFINGAGLLTSIGGSKLRWWIDPMGAIMLSCLVSSLWLSTAYKEFMLLIGVSADTAMLRLITYISMTHSPSVLALDTVRAWHSGPRLIVEVDVVMDPEETLRATHDVAEELQTKLESLPDVDRAYVHVDYETSHAPEHFLKKEL